MRAEKLLSLGSGCCVGSGKSASTLLLAPYSLLPRKALSVIRSLGIAAAGGQELFTGMFSGILA